MYTVGDILAMEHMSDAQLVAGEGGITRGVTWVTIMEVPEVAGWMRGGELLLTAAFALVKVPELQQRIIPLLLSKNVAALAIKPGQHLKSIPDGLREQADAFSFPIIELPREMPYFDVMEPIMHALMNDEMHFMREIETLRRRLEEALLGGGGPGEVCQILSETLGGMVFLLDSEGKPIWLPRELKSDRLELLLVSISRALNDGSGVTPLTSDNNAYIYPVSIQGQRIAYLIIWAQDYLPNRIRRLSNEAVQILRLKLSPKSALVLDTCTKDQMLNELLFSDKPNVSLDCLGERAANDPYAVFVLAGELPEGVPEHESQVQLIQSSLHYFPQTHVIWVDGLGLVGLASCRPPFAWNSFHRALKMGVNRLKKGFQRGVTAAVGSPHPGVKGIRKSFDEARYVSSLWRKGLLSGSADCADFASLGFYGLVYEMREQPSLERFCQQVVGALLDYDARNGTDLVHTLLVYFRNGESLNRAASSLYIHRNTLAYRLSRIQTITGLDMRNPEHAFHLNLAVRASTAMYMVNESVSIENVIDAVKTTALSIHQWSK